MKDATASSVTLAATDGQPSTGAIAVPVAVAKLHSRDAAREFRRFGDSGGDILGMHEVKVWPRQHFFCRMRERPTPGRIQGFAISVDADDAQHVRRELEIIRLDPRAARARHATLPQVGTPARERADIRRGSNWPTVRGSTADDL